LSGARTGDVKLFFFVKYLISTGLGFVQSGTHISTTAFLLTPPLLPFFLVDGIFLDYKSQFPFSVETPVLNAALLFLLFTARGLELSVSV
jgi:hypothetical protein